MDVDRQILVLIINNQISVDVVKFNFFSFSKPKVVYLRSLLPFILFLKFLKQNFMYYFGHKHTET